MNIQTKSSLVIIFTLVIGITLGILIDRTLLHQSLQQRIERFQTPVGLAHIFERIIQPAPGQMEQIRIILQKHAKKMNDYRIRSRTEMNTLMDSLRIELEPILTAEQREKLKDSLERMERRPFGPRGRRSGRRFENGAEPPPPLFEKGHPFMP